MTCVGMKKGDERGRPERHLFPGVFIFSTLLICQIIAKPISTHIRYSCYCFPVMPVISVLVVDDEAPFLDLCRLYLERSGQFSVTTMISPTQALRVLEDRTFDIIVSDYFMPEMDGVEFLARIRKYHGCIPFILLTGRGNEDVAISAINKGADYYLQKTGDVRDQFSELEYKLGEAVRRSKAEKIYRESSSILSAVMESSPDGILVTADDGRILKYNDRLVQIWGIPGNVLELGEENAFLAFMFGKVKDPSMILERFREIFRDPVQDIRDQVECKDGKIIEVLSIPFAVNDSMMGRVWRFRHAPRQ